MDAPTKQVDAAAMTDGSEEWPRIRGVSWSPSGSRQLGSLADLSASLADPEARVWVDVTAPSHIEVGSVTELLALHPLIAEDIAERNARAKITEIDGTLHIVLFWVVYAGEIAASEIDIVLNHRSLLTVHEPGWDPLAMQQLRKDPAQVLSRGVDFMLYVITDGIVDGYFPVLDAIEDEIDGLQDDVIRKPTTWTLERLFALKRELIGLRRAVSPSREIFNQLTNRDRSLVSAEHVIYFRDVYDHLIRVTDELDNDREMVAGTLEVYLSTINNNLSVIMKRLTGVTVVIAGIGAVAGIFGMSEAAVALAGGEGSGFWLVTSVVVAGAAFTAWVLRRNDWI
ncbi:MAG: magnesium transporter CorA family protein [Chloroflexota bacterium]